MGTGEVHTEFWWRNLNEKDHLQDVDVKVEGQKQNGFSRSTMRGMDWIDLAQDWDRWRALVKSVRVP